MTMQLRVHYFQHIAGEGFGSCENYLKSKNAKISATEFFALPIEYKLDIEALPNIDEVDLLIIMGGTMSVNDEATYPWLVIEKRWLRRYIASGKPVIGLCLGGQLIASALGASVTQNPQREIGWTAIKAVNPYPIDCFVMPEQCEIMQWHGETFALPQGARLLAENTVCSNQAFQIGKNVIGFQFHPEITQVALKNLIENEQEVELFVEQVPNVRDRLKQAVSHDALKKFQTGNLLLNQAIDYVLAHSVSMQNLIVDGLRATFSDDEAVIV